MSMAITKKELHQYCASFKEHAAIEKKVLEQAVSLVKPVRNPHVFNQIRIIACREPDKLEMVGGIQLCIVYDGIAFTHFKKMGVKNHTIEEDR